jgi:hypothetical protein
MNAGPTPSNKHAPRGLPFILFTAVLLPIVICLIWFLSNRWSTASAIRRLEAKARKNGEPLTYAELAATYPPIPDNQNGAALIMDAWEKDNPLRWRSFRDGAELLPEGKPEDCDPAVPYIGSVLMYFERTNDVSSASLKAADVYLRQRKDQMDQIRKGLNYSKFWFPVRISDGSEMLVPHLAELKREALDFSIEALVASERGDVDSAIAATEYTARTGMALKSEPLIISQFVRLACYGIALNDVERLLSRRRLSPAQLDRLTTFLQELRTPGGMRLALIDYRVSDLYIVNDAWERVPGAGLIGIGQSAKMQVLTECDRLLSLGDPDKPEVLRESDMSYVAGKAATRFAAFEARRRAAITALAVERYRIQHDGKLPQQLSDITPELLAEIPSDPFDGKPLRFKKLPVGFVVYSVGPKQVNGGDERPHRDNAFFIER